MSVRCLQPRATQSTCHLQQSVSEGAFPMVNMSDDAEVSYLVHRKLGHINVLLRKTQIPVRTWLEKMFPTQMN